MTHYNIRSEKSLLKLYPSLQPATELLGVYEPELPGPKILRPFKKLFLNLSGLPGWGGKHFMGDYALNMIKKNGCVVKGPKMIISTRAHKMDSRQGLVATYTDDAPFIWRHCTDEFRVINDNLLLGMSYFDLPGFRGMPVMFLLRRAPDNSGVA